MGIEESWFSSLWRTSRKSIATNSEKAKIGILAFEVAGVMTKVVTLWQCLSDFQIGRLREEIGNSFGVKKLVSDDDEYLMDLALAEMIENLVLLAKSVARLGKRCKDPTYHRLDHVFDDPIGFDFNWCGREYKLKKMEMKVKKMERFVAVTAQLHQELDVLAELEQTLRRMKANADLGQVKLLEFQKKVMWQRQEVKNLREASPWIRTYDYTVRLLLRSLFTIVCRITQLDSAGEIKISENMDENFLSRSLSLSARLLTSVYPAENRMFGMNSRPLVKSASSLGGKADKIISKKKYLNNFPGVVKTKRLAHGSFGGCIPEGTESPFTESCMQTRNSSLRSSNTFSSERYIAIDNKPVPLFTTKRKLLKASLSTLGGGGLALHYANVIVLIEKLALAPHLISLDARDDLYHMLPMSVRSTLRVKLKLIAKTPASSLYDATLAAEWGLALARILEWLAPLAHNMIRWHSVRNFEKHHLFSDTNTLLVQTLYFANLEKTEAAIVELLMGLNYLSRFGGEIDKLAFVTSGSGRGSANYFPQGDNTICCT